MKLIISVIVSLIPLSVFAAGGGGGGGSSTHTRITLAALYGRIFVEPNDINTAVSGTVPKLASITSGTSVGGHLGYMLSPRLELGLEYMIYQAQNTIATTLPPSSDAGWILKQNEIWAGFNYYFMEMGHTFAYLGAFGGYPTSSVATLKLNTSTDYVADKTFGGKGQLGVGIMFGGHFSLFVQGGYMSMVSGKLKSTTNGVTTTLTTSSGREAKMDLTGGFADAGIALKF